MKNIFNFKLIFPLLLVTIFSLNTKAADFYWVGNSGNWSDFATHWATSPGGTTMRNNAPTINDRVIFDSLSFTATGHTVTFDVGNASVQDIYFQTQFNPTFLGAATDTISIFGSLNLAPSLTYSFSGELFFSTSTTDSIVTAGHTLLNNINIGGIGTYNLIDDLTVNGKILHSRGTLNAANRTIVAEGIGGDFFLIRTLNVANSTLTLTGSDFPIEFSSGNLTTVFTNTDVNLTYAGSDTVEIATSNNAQLPNVTTLATNIDFYDNNKIDTLTAINALYIGFELGRTFSFNDFNVAGNCGNYLFMIGRGGVANFNNNANPQTLNFIRLRNLTEQGSANVLNNSFDEGNNTNFTINEQAGGTPYFWIGGQGDYYDPAHWSFISGGATSGCVPGQNDFAIFDASSGITANDSLILSKNIIIADLNFRDIPASFVLTGEADSIIVRDSLIGSNFLVFDWKNTIALSKTGGVQELVSNGAIWGCEIRKYNTATLSLLDTLQSSADINIYASDVEFNKLPHKFFNFTAVSSTGINADSTDIEVSGLVFDIEGADAIMHLGAKITCNYLGDEQTTFHGGGYTFDTVYFESKNLLLDGANTFDYLFFTPGTTNTIMNSTVQTFDTIVANGTCAERITFRSFNQVSAAPIFSKIGLDTAMVVDYATIDNIDTDTTGLRTYGALNSNVINGADYWIDTLAIPVDTAFYWIGDGGDWSDTSHWSYMSGGPVAGCLPTVGDTVYFDAMSFSLPNQIVHQDVVGYAKVMDWSGATNSPEYNLTQSIILNDDAIFKKDVAYSRNNRDAGLNLQADTILTFTTDSAFIEFPIIVDTKSIADSVQLNGFLNLDRDSSSLIVLSGLIDTKGFDISAANFTLITGEIKRVILDTSFIDLAIGFEDNSGPFLTLLSGTSLISIDSNIVENYFRSNNGLTFHDVELRFHPNSYNPVSGSNTFNNLTIHKGSKVEIEALTTQTVNGDLIMTGDCRDSIYLRSNSPGDEAIFLKATDSVQAACISMKDIHTSGAATFKTYFSTDSLNNTGWTFDTTPATTATFAIAPFVCFGDTTTFTNSSTAFDGNVASLNYSWDFGDGETFDGDTLMHAFAQPGDLDVTLVSEFTNFCKDTLVQTVSVRDPKVTISFTDADTIICAGEEVSIYAASNPSTVTYEFFLNGVSQNTASNAFDTLTTSTLADNDTIFFVSVDNGCTVNSDTLIFTVNALPTATLSSTDTTICLNDTVQINAGGGDEYRFFNKSFTYGFFNTQDSLVLDNLVDMDSIYSIALDTVTNCVDTSTAIIFTVNPLPTTTLTSSDADLVICDGDLVTFTGGGATSYQYFTNGVAQTTFIPGSFDTTLLVTTDTISVMGQTALGCLAPAPQELTLIVNPIPTMTIAANDADTSICAGTNVQFTFSGASVYEVFINGVSQGAATGSPIFNTATLADGDLVSVEGTTNNCTGYSDTLVWEVIPNPALTFSSSDANDTICSGETVTFTAGGATSYEFFINGISQGAASATPTFVSSTLLNGQNISVSGSALGCSSSSQITFGVNPSPNINFFTSETDLTICEGDNVDFTVSNAVNYEFFVNDVSQGAASAATTYSTTTLPNGNPEVFAVGYSAEACTDTSSTLTFTVHALPTTTLTSSDADDIICEGESVTFTGAGAGEYQFLIDGGAQGLPNSNNTFTTNNLNDGQVVTVTGFNNGCANPSADSYTMTVTPVPTVGFTSDDADNNFCIGAAVTFTASGATTYEYFVNTVSQGAPSATNTFDASTLPVGTNTIQVVGVTNNCSATGTIIANVQASPSTSLTSSDADNIICDGTNVNFTASGASVYEFFVNTISQGAASPNTIFSSNTLVDGDLVEVIGTNTSGCIAAVTPQITTTVLPTPTITLTSDNLTGQLCEGDITTFTATGGTTYEFFVNGFSAQGPNASATYVTDSITNSQTISVVGSDGSCESDGDVQFTYSVNPIPLIQMTNNTDTVLCTGELTDVISSGASNYLYYVNGAPQGAFNATATFQNTLNNGDILTVEGEINNCFAFASNSITYSLFTFPTTTVTSSDADNVICKDDLVTFTAAGAMEYEFFVDALSLGQSTNAVYNTDQIADGETISVIGYNADCAQNAPTTFMFTVNEMTLSVTANPADYIICEGEPIDITAAGGDEYEFFLNAVSQGAQSATSTFTYPTVNAGDAISVNAFNTTTGCTQSLDNDIYPTVIAAPVLVANNATVFCEGDSTTLVSNAIYGNQWFMDGAPIAGATDTFYVAYLSGDYTFEFTAGGTGEVWSIGYNANGEFGSGNNFNSPIPTVAEMLTNATLVSAGNEFTGALLADGTVWNWGQNSSGQLGQGTFTGSASPLLVNGLPAITNFGAGGSHAHAVDGAGNVYAWGENNFGQLGNGNTAVVNFPQLLASINGVSTVKSGLNHTVFLKTDGTVWSVGSNNFGQLGDGTITSTSTPVQVTGLANIVSIGSGENHSFAIDNNGALYVWGANSFGQLGLGDVTNRLNATLSGLDEVQKADGGANHSVFLTTDGKVYSSGGNQYGQLGVGTQTDSWVLNQNSLNAISDIAVGQYHTVAIKADNSVWGNGRNQNNQLGDLAPVEILSPTLIPNVEGATIVEAGKSSTNFIYGNANTCVSNTIAVTANATPQATINVVGTDLTANAGANYEWYIDGIVIAGVTTQVMDPQATGDYTVLVTYANGCSSLSAPFYHEHVGLEELELGSISLYPNPTSDQLYIDLSHLKVNESVVMNVRDMAGRTILSKSLTGVQETVDVNTWVKGVYVLEFQIGEYTVIKRVVKQ